MRAAIVDILTNIVVNIVVADAAIDLAPDGTLLIDVTDVFCDIGWVYDPDTGNFTNYAE